MPTYANIGGARRELSNIYGNIGGARRELSYMYANIGGAQKEIFGLVKEVRLNTLNVNDIFYLNESGIPQPWRLLYKTSTSLYIIERVDALPGIISMTESIATSATKVRYSTSTLRTKVLAVENTLDTAIRSALVSGSADYPYQVANGAPTSETISDKIFAVPDANYTYFGIGNRTKKITGGTSNVAWWYWHFTYTLSGQHIYRRFYRNTSGAAAYTQAPTTGSMTVEAYAAPFMAINPTVFVMV